MSAVRVGELKTYGTCAERVTVSSIPSTGERGGALVQYQYQCWFCGRFVLSPVVSKSHSQSWQERQFAAACEQFSSRCEKNVRSTPYQMLLDIVFVLNYRQKLRLEFAVKHQLVESLEESVVKAWEACEDGMLLGWLIYLFSCRKPHPLGIWGNLNQPRVLVPSSSGWRQDLAQVELYTGECKMNLTGLRSQLARQLQRPNVAMVPITEWLSASLLR